MTAGERSSGADLRDNALARLDRLIGQMSRPLPRWQRLRGWHEGNGGWTEDSRRQWLERFQELRRRVAAGGAVEDEAHHLLRWLDHDGIIGGEWFREAAVIQSDLWELARRRRGRPRRP